MALTDGLQEWFDLTSDGNGNHAGTIMTEVGSPSYSANGMTITNAGGDHLTLANASAGIFFPRLGDMSFAGWARTDGSYGTSFNPIFTMGGTGGGTPGWQCAYRDNNDFWMWMSDGGSRPSGNTAGTPLIVDQFQFMYFELDRSANESVEIDNANTGVQSITGAAGDILPVSDFFIGGGFVGAPNATYRSFGFWNRLLTTDERVELYNSGTPLSYSDISGGGSNLILPNLTLQMGLGV